MNDFAPPPETGSDRAPAPAPRIPTVDDFPDAGPNALGSFTQRAFARVIDELLTDIPVVLVFFAVLVVSGDIAAVESSASSGSSADGAPMMPLWLIIGGVAFAVLYETLAVAWFGRTVGKWALGLRVARYADGKKPTLDQAVLRCLLPVSAGVFALWIAGSTPVGAMIVFASAFFNPLRRGWHDAAGGTIVVRTR